jgi:hypothetical protein
MLTKLISGAYVGAAAILLSTRKEYVMDPTESKVPFEKNPLESAGSDKNKRISLIDLGPVVLETRGDFGGYADSPSPGNDRSKPGF